MACVCRDAIGMGGATVCVGEARTLSYLNDITPYGLRLDKQSLETLLQTRFWLTIGNTHGSLDYAGSQTQVSANGVTAV